MTTVSRHDHPSRPCDVTLSSEMRRGVVTRVLGAILSPGVRDRVGFAQNTGRPVPFNFCRLRAGWSFAPLVQACKQSRSRVSNALECLLGLLAHDEQKTTGAKTCSPQIKGT